MASTLAAEGKRNNAIASQTIATTIRKTESRVPAPSMGLFRQLCITVVAGELYHHTAALLYGETDYPLIVHINDQDHLVKFPGFDKIVSYLNH